MELKLLSLVLALLRVAVAATEAEVSLDQLAAEELVARQAASTTSLSPPHLSVTNSFSTTASQTTLLVSSSSGSAVSSTITSSQHGSSNTTTTSVPASVTLTGAFTANGGMYDVTSVSGVAIVAGHSLYVGGPDAFVGGVVVTEAANGFLANGTPVPLKTASVSSSSTSSSTSPTTTSANVLSTAATTTTSSHPGAAAKTGVPVFGAAIALAMGVMAL